VKQYDPKDVTIEWNTVALNEGIAAGTFVLATQTNPDWVMSVGGDGEVTRVRSNDASGTITVTLKQGSAANDALTLIFEGDKLSSAALGALTVKDNQGDALCIGVNAFIEGPPDFERADTETTNEWVFLCERIQFVHRGNAGINASDS
jgi:hypothetical protein